MSDEAPIELSDEAPDSPQPPRWYGPDAAFGWECGWSVGWIAGRDAALKAKP